MKKITLIAIILIGALAIAPFVIGIQAQSNLETQLARYEKSTNGFATAEIEKYDRGWLSATAQVKTTFTQTYLDSLAPALGTSDDPNGLMAALQQGFTQQLNISHGFFTEGGFGLAYAEGQVDGSTNPMIAELLSQTGNDYFVRWDFNIGLSGLGDLNMVMPSFEISNSPDEGPDINFAGGEASGTIDLSSNQFTLDGAFNGLSFGFNELNFVLEKATLTSDTQYVDQINMALGSADIVLERFLLVSGNETGIDIKNISATTSISQSTEDPALLNIAATYTMDELLANNERVDDIVLTMEIANLAEAPLNQLQTLNAQSQQDPAAQLTALTEPVYELLKSSPTLRLAPIEFKYNEQDFRMNLLVASHADRLPTADAFSLDNPLIMSSLFSIETDLSINKALATTWITPQLKQQLMAGIPEGTEIDDAQLDAMAAAQAPMLLGTMVGQGMLNDDGDNYSLKASYDLGALKVNDNPVPLGALMGGVP